MNSLNVTALLERRHDVATKRRASAPQAPAVRPQSGWTFDSDQNEDAYIYYDELVKSRNRLALLPPLTPQDLDRASRAMSEVIFHLMMPPPGRKTELPLPEHKKARLLAAARDRSLDLYVMTVALVAQKLALTPPKYGPAANDLFALTEALDALTFDYRAPKSRTVSLLRQVKADIDARIAYVRTVRPSSYRFAELPEMYQSRPNKKERPDQFFGRVYAGHVPRGLTQADIRRVDPAFYNVLHVWCTRHKRKMSRLVPASRDRRD